MIKLLMQRITLHFFLSFFFALLLVLLEDGWMGRINDLKQKEKQQTAPAAMGGLPQEWKY